VEKRENHLFQCGPIPARGTDFNAKTARLIADLGFPIPLHIKGTNSLIEISIFVPCLDRAVLSAGETLDT
jgi:hypothetical protein